MPEVSIREIKDILKKDIDYEIKEYKNFYLINLKNIDWKEYLRILYYTKTINYAYYRNKKITYSKRTYLVKNKITVDPTLISKILYYSNLSKEDIILNINDKYGIISIEQSLILKNFPILFWGEEQIFEKEDYSIIQEFEKELTQKLKSNIYLVDKDNRTLSITKKNLEKALVKDVVYLRKIDYEWLDIKFKNKKFDKIFFYYKKSKKIMSIYEKYVFFHSDILLKDRGKLYIILKLKNMDTLNDIISNYINYSKKYSIKFMEKYNFQDKNYLLAFIVFAKI